jgi:iron complex outermembrane receptor protein
MGQQAFRPIGPDLKPPRSLTIKNRKLSMPRRFFAFSAGASFASLVMLLLPGAVRAAGPMDAAPPVEAAPPAQEPESVAAPAVDVVPAAAAPELMGAVPSGPNAPGAEPAQESRGDGAAALNGFDIAGKVRDIADLDLEALLQNTVVTATKSEVKEDEAPAIATVIGREEIRRWGYRSTEEALRHVAGVYVIDDHIIPNLGIRGVSGGLRSESGLVKVMIDGHSVAFRSTAGNWLGPELIPLSAVQQIEVIRGPASALYGADAFLGVINIVTRRPEDMKGGELGVVGDYAGSTLQSGQDATLGAEVGKLRLLASYRLYTEDRSGLQLPRQSPSPQLPGYASADGRSRDLVQGSNVAFLKASYQVMPAALLSVSGYFSQLDRGAEFADWAQLTHGIDASGRSNGTNISLRQGMVDVRADVAVSPQLDLTVDGFLFAGGPTSRDRIEVGSDTYYIKRDFGYVGTDIGAEANWRPRSNLSVLAGVGYILDHEDLMVARSVLKTTVDTTSAGDIQTSRSGAVSEVSFSSPAVHAQVIYSPWGSRLTIAAGARYDYHNIYGGQWSGRLGGVLSFSENVHLKLLYGSAFKAPSPELLYSFPVATGDIMGNPALKPSHIHTVEAQLSYRPGKYVFMATGLAGNYLLDQAEFAQQGDNQVAGNIGKTTSLSWESELQIDYRKLVMGYANVAVNKTVESTNQQGYVADLTNYGNLAYPVLVANAGISGKRLRGPMRLGLEGSYVTARRASRTNILDNGGLYAYPRYFVLGGSLQTVGVSLLAERETIFRLTARNLFGTRIVDPGFAGVDYPQLGRTVMVQVIQEW